MFDQSHPLYDLVARVNQSCVVEFITPVPKAVKRPPSRVDKLARAFLNLSPAERRRIQEALQ